MELQRTHIRFFYALPLGAIASIVAFDRDEPQLHLLPAEHRPLLRQVLSRRRLLPSKRHDPLDGTPSKAVHLSICQGKTYLTSERVFSKMNGVR